ncbi:MAG: indole-3-glycerol phosphate synthase TrpC [Paludibacteraceae bacterium]|nr:indole-3-glycerol phosphate synthase TrpC [Paludibacteraceae bacterium]
MTILDKIVDNKRIELETMKKEFPIEKLKESEYFTRKGFSMKQSLANSSTGIISEFKRKSPSKGFIKEGAIVTEITPGYEAAGASGISVLADKDFFGGGFADVKAARGVVKHTPILFKEFLFDEYQLYLAKASGADVVLLIASIMDVETCHRLAAKAKELDLETLLELYEPEEVSHIHPTVDMVGINNRNLKTFEVDLAASIKLCNSIPDDYLKVSESGISNPETVKMLRKEGFRGFLMGENFMKQPDPAKGLQEFISALNA